MGKWDDRSLVSIKEYGKINLRLKEMIDSREMTRNRLAELIDTRFSVIDKWYKNEVERLDLDVLARICYVLDCEPSDLISYDRKEEET